MMHDRKFDSPQSANDGAATPAEIQAAIAASAALPHPMSDAFATAATRDAMA